MNKQRFLGDKFTVLSSLVLLVISTWEASVRLDAMYKPLKMFFDMAIGEHIPLSSVISYVDISMLEAPLWLLGCTLAALITIFFVRRPAGSAVTLPLSIVLGVYGLLRESTFLTGIWRLVQPALLLFIAFVIIMNIAVYPLRRRIAERKSRKRTKPSSPRLEDAPKLRSLSREKSSERRSA